MRKNSVYSIMVLMPHPSVLTNKKRQPMRLAFSKFLIEGGFLFCWLGLFQANNAVAICPLAALFEQFDTFESLQYVAFYRGCAG